MLEVIRFGTSIDFILKSESDYISKGELIKLQEYAKLRKCYFQFDSSNLAFRICNWERCFTKDEISMYIFDISRIVKSNLNFNIEVIKDTNVSTYSLIDFHDKYVD